jgi:Glu-tRNA(Gln) amidotransferase subunit E-like FAD-binding protein
VRVIACLDDLPNLVASSQNAPSLSSGEWERVIKAVGAEGDVPVVVVWGPRADVETAVREVVLRARDAVRGVPNETRQALDDGTNGFERILPGADRMYPDTDLPPIRLEDARIDGIAARLPLRPWERQERLRTLGVGHDLAARLARHRAWDLFERLVTLLPEGGAFDAHRLASLLLDRECPRPASLRAAGPWWEALVRDLASGAVIPEAAWTAEDEVPRRAGDDEAARLLAAAWAEALADGGADLPDDPAKREHALMGRVMPRLRGRVAGSLARGWIAAAMKEAR